MKTSACAKQRIKIRSFVVEEKPLDASCGCVSDNWASFKKWYIPWDDVIPKQTPINRILATKHQHRTNILNTLH